jgi:phage tail sheath protein FI
MAYQHGIYGNIASTIMPASNVASRGIQVVIGTAPINLLSNPSAAVNTPILLSSLSDVKSSLGYSTDLDKYTIMQAVHATFEVFDLAPIVAINVLDPAKHVTAGKTSNGAMASGTYTISDKGVLLSTLVVKDGTGATTYDKGSDYTAAFNSDGTLTITRIATGDITTATSEIETTYSVIDPTKVTAEDVVAGIAYVNRVFQATDCIPEILIAPGFAQGATVGAALISAAESVSTVFKATALVDIDSSVSTTIAAAIAAKTTDCYTSRNAVVCYPKVITNQSKTVYMSAMLAALMQYTDSLNESTPFISPSNKTFNILGTVLAGGTSVLYTLDEANQLNAEGIFTAINFQGWKSWGDNTGYYSYAAEQAGTTYDPVDKYINVKRAFDWQNNGFITRYFAEIDDPMNYRAIQTLITDENQFYNAFIAAGMVAGMSIVYSQKENTIASILAGKIVFHQYMTPYLPMQTIENTMQFDPTMLAAALGGASS